MPYIGKNPVGGGFHKLDALTASATDTYALTLGSAAYYPESANQLLVSLNGVIQAPQDSFTVSGSNLVFDTALTASDSIDFVVALGDVLAVQTVTDGAITTAKLGNGSVTSAKLGNSSVDLTSKVTGVLPVANGGTGSNSIYFTRFELSADQTSNAVITNWASMRLAKQISSVGTAVTVSSGIFTFPVTGVWKITFQARILSGSGDSTAGVYLNATTDNSTYTNYIFASEGDSAGTSTGGIFIQDILNVDDISNVKVQFEASSLASGSQIYGASTGSVRTWCSFERITDAQ